MALNESIVQQLFWLLVITFAIAVLARRIRVPYELALVVTGLAVGATHLLPRIRLEPTVLMLVFLPPLLFESAINLRIQHLKRDYAPIVLFTLAGTIFSTLIVGIVFSRSLGLRIEIGLVFGALISTTDPISVIAIFRRLGTDRRLSLIIEAESLFNNDVAVVLFTVITGAFAGGHISVLTAAAQFLALAMGGALVGATVGTLASLIHFELDDHLAEITLTNVVAFGAYLGAEALHCSGVMAVVVAGIIVGNWAIPSGMSAGTQLAVAAFWDYAGFAVNSVVFLLVGIEVTSIGWHDKLTATVCAIAAVLLGRAAIYPIAMLLRVFGGSIPRSWQHVLYWGGLRGALSMALVLGLNRNFPAHDLLVAATFGTVLFSLLVQGTTVGRLVTTLGLIGNSETNMQAIGPLLAQRTACQAALMELTKMFSEETYAPWEIQTMIRDYSEKCRVIETEIESKSPGYLQRKQGGRAEMRSRVISAEKGALQEAERLGEIGASDWVELRKKLDGELLELRSQEFKSSD